MTSPPSNYEWPTLSEWDTMMAKRYGPANQALIQAARVAVAGLGGLGSHVAAALARAGVGFLRLIDFDRVEVSNLGRQYYSINHLGQLKTDALAAIIAEINPYVGVNPVNAHLTRANIPRFLTGWPIIVEALDRPEAKAELVTTALAAFPEAKVVCASGLAGFESANTIVTRQRSPRLYLCGDETSEAGPGQSLTAARVMVCAGHQANMVLRLILNNQEP